MAFFNLTKLGVQDPIKSALREEDKCPHSTRSEEEPSSVIAGTSTNNGLKHSTEAQGSYVKYTERLTKHQRTKNDPNEIYTNPVIVSQDYGWWSQDGAPQSLPWTNVQRLPRVNSEMTRFVDEMTMTNKHFTLF